MKGQTRAGAGGMGRMDVMKAVAAFDAGRPKCGAGVSALTVSLLEAPEGAGDALRHHDAGPQAGEGLGDRERAAASRGSAQVRRGSTLLDLLDLLDLGTGGGSSGRGDGGSGGRRCGGGGRARSGRGACSRQRDLQRREQLRAVGERAEQVHGCDLLRALGVPEHLGAVAARPADER